MFFAVSDYRKRWSIYFGGFRRRTEREMEKQKRVATCIYFCNCLWSRDALFRHLCEQLRRWTTRSCSQIENTVHCPSESQLFISPVGRTLLSSKLFPPRCLGMRNSYRTPQASSVRRHVSQTFDSALKSWWKSLCVGIIEFNWEIDINRIERKQVFVISVNLDSILCARCLPNAFLVYC